MNNTDLEITENNEEGKYFIFAKGRVDSNSADNLLEKLENALNIGHKIIILNMSRVDYLSSIGIRVLLKVYKQANDKGAQFKIDRPSKMVKNVLGMVALKELLVINSQ